LEGARTQAVSVAASRLGCGNPETQGRVVHMPALRRRGREGGTGEIMSINTPERNLAIAVLLQAVVDLGKAMTPPKRNPKDSDEEFRHYIILWQKSWPKCDAARFLTAQDSWQQSLEFWCELAGFSYEAIRDKAMRLIDRAKAGHIHEVRNSLLNYCKSQVF